MKTTSHNHSITVSIVDSIQITAREADFLRQMAKHCVSTRMPGALACERLIEILDRANIPTRGVEPDYGIFEDPDRTPAWIKP